MTISHEEYEATRNEIQDEFLKLRQKVRAWVPEFNQDITGTLAVVEDHVLQYWDHNKPGLDIPDMQD